MGKILSYLFVLVASATFCLANTLVFFQPGACNLGRSHVQCSNAGPGYCCTSGNPWCGSLSCPDCVQGNDLYAYNQGGCSVGAYNSCREPGNGAYCCINLGGGNTCAGNWYVGGARKRSLAMSQVRGIASTDGNKTMTPEEAANCKKLVEPNKMVYTDAEGVQHEIHMPAGTFKTASEHYVAQNYDELKKFPAWGKCWRRQIFLTFPSLYLSSLVMLSQPKLRRGSEEIVQCKGLHVGILQPCQYSLLLQKAILARCTC